MGYKINSPWTKIREKDINRLNEIIDDEYCNEMEIGRKLHILETFEKKLNEEINRFKFDIVIKFMKANKWTWFLYKNGKSSYEVPTKEDIIDSIKDNFKHGLFEIIELNHNRYGSSGGGIVFEMGMLGEYPSDDNCYIDIYFDIAHYSK